MCFFVIPLGSMPVAVMFGLPPDDLLTSGQGKYDVELEYMSLYPCTEDFTYEDNVFIITKAEELNTMSTGEDESSPGLNGRLRPRKPTITTPSPHKSTRKSEGKLTEDRPKNTPTPSKASPNKQDDLTAKPDISPTSLFLCPYCDRKFTSKQTASKHARRIHLFSSKQDNFIKCLYCNHSEAESNLIIKHMVDNHPNQYFACLNCYTRFSATTELAEHKHNVCEKQKPSYRNKLRQKPNRTRKNTKRSNRTHDKNDIQNENTECSDELRFNGMVISCELKPSQTHDAADIEDNLTTNLILPPSKALGKSVMEKNAVIVLDDIQWNKRIPPNFSFHNTDADQILSRLGVVHRSPRVGESTKKEWIKIVDESIQKFERCFDTNFYSKVAKNVQENLTKFLDGSFNFNPNKENTIKTRKSKTGVVINTAEGFPILLAYEQYSRNLFDGYMPRALAPKHKWKWDCAETDKSVVTHIVDSKRDSHVNNCIITLVSSLDIWTQLQMRRKFEDIFKITPTAKKTEKQNIIGRELKEILESRDIPSNSTQVVKYQRSSTDVTHISEPPAHLGLKPVAPTCELKPAVLSGEWVRPRCYVCCACGEQTNDARTLSSHISTQHPNAQVQHYEIVGETLLSADILKHLYVPPSQMSNRTRPPRGFRDCTKCKKSITLEDLHQHMLDCAGDTPAVRRKVRYRPFGVRRRRPRLPDSTIRKKIRKDIRSRHRQKCHLRARPRIRTEVGDAESIRKMIADLPAKRNRIITLPTARPRRNVLTAKKAIKLRSSEDIKTAKVRTVKKITRLKKVVTSKKQPEIDTSIIDEDDQPLKLSSKRESSRNTTSGSASPNNSKVKDNDLKDFADKKLSKHQKKLLKTEILMRSDHQKVDVYGAGPSNVRQQSNRSNNSNNQDNRDRRSSGEKNNENGENNITPAPNVPFKQCVGSSTSKAESIEHNTLPCDSHYVPGRDTSPVPRLIADDQQTFENDIVEDKFDKPPLWKDSSESSILSRDKSKLSKNKKGLEHCIAMLRTKKGLPDSNKGNKPLNPELSEGNKSNISHEQNPKRKQSQSPTSPVSLEQNSLDAGSESADQASKTRLENKGETMYPFSAADVYRGRPSIENKSILPKIQNNLSPRRQSLGRNEPKVTDSMVSHKPLELTPWVPLSSALHIAGDAYSDFNLMRRNSYEPTLTSGSLLYQNAISAASAINIPNISNIVHNAHPHMARNADSIAWHHQASYQNEIYNQLVRASFTTDGVLPPQYSSVQHGQIDASIPATPIPKKRRDSHRKELMQDQQRDRKQKISPSGRPNPMSSSYHDVGKQACTSPEALNTHLSSNCYSTPEVHIHAPAPPSFRVRRESHKRGVESSDSELNFTVNAEDCVSGKVLRKSPRPYYPENTVSLLNLRRHSMDIGAATHTNKQNYDANLILQQHLIENETFNVSPHSRGRSESRTTTPDSHRLFYEHERARELANELHSRNMSMLAMRNDMYEEMDNRIIHEKQLQDAMAAHIQSLEQYQRNHFQNVNPNSTADNYVKKDIDGTHQKVLNELQHKHRTRKRSEGQAAVASNVYQPNIPSEKHQNQKARDNKSIKQDIPSQNNPISFGNLPKSLEITAHKSSSGTYSPPDFRTKPPNNHPSESNKRRYSENQDSLVIAHPHIIHRPELVYSALSVGEGNASDQAMSNVAVPEIPLDLSRKDHNLTDSSTKHSREPPQLYPEIPIMIENEKYNESLALNLQVSSDQALNLSPQNQDTKDGILSEQKSTDSINSVHFINEKLCEESLCHRKINAHDFSATKAIPEPPNLILVHESREDMSMAGSNVNLPVFDSEIDLRSQHKVNLHDSKDTDFKRHPFYNPLHLQYHDQSNKISDASGECLSQPGDIETISRIEEKRHNDVSLDIRNYGKNANVKLDTTQTSITNVVSDNVPLNLINADDTIVCIDSDDEDSQHKTNPLLLENVKVTEVSNQVDVGTVQESVETNTQVTNSGKQVLTDQNKGLDPETFANLEELVVNNEARKRRDKSDTSDANPGNLKTIHQYIANVLEQMNEVQIKRMLGISPTLMAKVKAATVNESIPSSPAPDTTINNNDNMSIAVCPSSVIPKKRYSPSQPFVRLSSSELCSTSPELGTSNMPNGLQTSQHESSNSNAITTSDYLESSNKDIKKDFESQLEKNEKDSDDSEINVVDIIEPDILSKINKKEKISDYPFQSAIYPQEISLRTPNKSKNFNEQTASLRAVRIKTPSSRKCGSDDKNIVMIQTKSSQVSKYDPDKTMSVDQSEAIPVTLPKQRPESMYDQNDYASSDINYSSTLPLQEHPSDDILKEDELKNAHTSKFNTISENDVLTNKVTLGGTHTLLPTADSVNEDIALHKQNKSLISEITNQVDNTAVYRTLQIMPENSRLLSNVHFNSDFPTKADNKEENIFLGQKKPTIFSGNNSNDKNLKEFISAAAEKTTDLSTENDCFITNDIPLVSATHPYEVLEPVKSPDISKLQNNNESKLGEDEIEECNTINTNTSENNFITLSQPITMSIAPRSSPIDLMSPKSKKSDADDSEDDVSLADILKKRNAGITAYDEALHHVRDVKNKDQQELGSDYIHTENSESLNKSIQNNTNKHLISSPNEEKNPVNNSCVGNIFTDEELKTVNAGSFLPKSPCAHNSDADSATKGYELSNNYHNIQNVENNERCASTLSEDHKCHKVKDIKETKCKPEQELSPNLKVDIERLDLFDNNGYDDHISSAGDDVVKQILLKSPKQGTDKTIADDFDTSTTISKNKRDIESYNQLNLICPNEHDETLLIADFKPVCEESQEGNSDTYSANDSPRREVNMQLSPEDNDANQMPLRRSRRGKSMYVERNIVGDYNVVVENGESKKTPLTMKRLILSRVQKDKNEEPETSSEQKQCVKDTDDIDSSNFDKLEVTHSKKVKPVKRKQSSHSKRKTKKSKSSNKPFPNEDLTEASNLEKGIILRELSNADNKIESKETYEEIKISHSPQNVSSELVNDLSQITDNKKDEEDNILNPVIETILSGKRKKNKHVTSKTKKAKYSKTKTYSDFDSEDDKELTEIKQRQEGLKYINKNEKTSDSLILQGKKDESYNMECEGNLEIDARTTVNVNMVGETRTTCYSRPNSNKRPQSSFESKKESINYDPYDIDFDEMIETTGPVLKRKGKSHTSKGDIKNKKGDVSEKISKRKEKVPLIYHDSDSDSSKSDVPLQKYVDEKEFDQKHQNDNNNKSINIDLEYNLDDSKLDNVCLESSGPVEQKNELSSEIVVNMDQTLKMNNTVADEPKPKTSKEKKGKRSFKKNKDEVDENDEDREAMSDKFMENFGFFSERLPRKSNLIATKKIAETFNTSNNESDDSTSKETKSKRKSSQSSQGKGETSEPNTSEGAMPSVGDGNDNVQASPQIPDVDNNIVNDQHDLHTTNNEIDNLPSQSNEIDSLHSQSNGMVTIQCDESRHLSLKLPPSPKEDSTIEKTKDIPLPVTETVESTQTIIQDKPFVVTEVKIVESTKKTKATVSKPPEKEYVIKPKMYPDIELTELDLMEDKFDKIKRKRRSQAVAAKQIQTIVEASSSKTRKQPDRKKSGKSGKKKCQNSQVPTKGALKGFESIKISIPTQDLNMPSSVSPPRQQKRKKRGNKRRKGTSESGSSCSEYDDKGKLGQDKDVYEFKDNEDTELLELRPSTVMDRFRSIHNNHKIKNKDKGKEKQKEKSKKTESKERHLSKEERSRMKANSSKKGNGKEHNTQDDDMNSESHSSENEHISCDFRSSDKYSGIKVVSSKRSTSTGEQNVEGNPDASPVQVSNDNRSEDVVPCTSAFEPDRDDESDYESESSIAGGCIVYKSDEFNCLCQSDLDSEESDIERTCGKSNCIYKTRNADKNAAIGNIFKNNAVRCDKPEIKVVEAPKPDLDQLFDSLLETKTDELSRSDSKLILDAADFLPVIDSLLEENDNKIEIAALNADNDINKNSYTRDSLILESRDSPNTDNNIPFMDCEDSYTISKDNLEPNVTTKSGVYNMVSTKSTQTGIISADNETETTYKKHETNPDDDEFDINEKESDEWMVFQELICPASKGSQTELSKLMYHCNEHIDCDLECQSTFTKYLEEISPDEVCVAVSTRGSQTVVQENQIHDVDADSRKTIKWKLTKKRVGVEVSDNCTQTDLQNFKYPDECEDDSDDNTLSEQDDCSATVEETAEENTKIYISSKRTNDRVASLPEGATCSSIAATSAAEIHSPSRKSDEGISTSHDCSADAFDQTLDDAGVARQRARRKCTVGKQNVLAEHWSSESEPEAVPPRRNSVDSVVATVARKKRGKKKEHSGSGKKGSRHGSRKERKHGARGRASSEDSSPAARRPPGPKIRAWPRHHYCSSDGEEPDPQPQHGWIVGDSHKKLVTMLAHAKGRKRSSHDKRQLDE